MIGPSPGILATILIMVVFSRKESIDELVEALDSNYLGRVPLPCDYESERPALEQELKIVFAHNQGIC
jgi:hypothetical protein